MYNRILGSEVLRLNRYFQVLTITGPRQSGKTTLCKQVFPNYDYVNLEDETKRADIELNRKGFLEAHMDGLLIDEVQNMPEILSAIQVVVDEHKEARFVLTGSNNFLLMQKITQSLAGRTALLTLLPLSLKELTEAESHLSPYELMYKGFYPAVWAKKIPVEDMYRQYFHFRVPQICYDVCFAYRHRVQRTKYVLGVGRFNTDGAGVDECVGSIVYCFSFATVL